MVARRRKKNPRAKDLRFLRQPKRRRCRCQVQREFRNRWCGADWQYNWGMRKNVSKIKNPQDAKHLAELDWVRIVENCLATERSA